MGGDCITEGMFQSKARLAAACATHSARSAGGVGCSAGPAEGDFARGMADVQETIRTIAPVDSQERFEGLGVQVVREAARFVDRRTVASNSIRVTARKFVIATGSRAAVPPIPGLDATPYLTNETVFELKALPERLIVLGGGPIGVELGQAFRRLGSEVVLVEAGDILGREDPEAAAVVRRQLLADGVEVLDRHTVLRVEPGPVLVAKSGDDEVRISGSHLLVAVGRTPSLEGLNLEAAGIAFDRQGVRTDRSLLTTNRRVFAIGDAAGRGQFTHLAGAHASLVVRRALFALPVNADALQVPRVTYCDPEVAAIGLGEAEARRRHGADVRVQVFEFAENDRAQAESDVRGFGKLFSNGRGKILGVTPAGRHSGHHLPSRYSGLAAGS